MPAAVTWLVRHGQSTSNVGLPATGNKEVELTGLGRQQARELAGLVETQPDVLVVSPFLRAKATAEYTLSRWPGTRCETWPIQELTYLSPARCRGTTPETRRPLIEAYWRRSDPHYLDGPDAESFWSFASRLADFHRRLVALDGEFAIIIGHGQFFRGYMMALREGFVVSPEWMQRYRVDETGNPMANCEIIALAGAQLKPFPLPAT